MAEPKLLEGKSVLYLEEERGWCRMITDILGDEGADAYAIQSGVGHPSPIDIAQALREGTLHRYLGETFATGISRSGLEFDLLLAAEISSGSNPFEIVRELYDLEVPGDYAPLKHEYRGKVGGVLLFPNQNADITHWLGPLGEKGIVSFEKTPGGSLRDDLGTDLVHAVAQTIDAYARRR